MRGYRKIIPGRPAGGRRPAREACRKVMKVGLRREAEGKGGEEETQDEQTGPRREEREESGE